MNIKLNFLRIFNRNFFYNFLGSIVLVAIIIMTGYTYHERPDTYSTGKTLPAIDPVISENLPHVKYKKLTDSIRISRELKNGSLGMSFNAGPFGYSENKRCDDCSSYFNVFEKNHTGYRDSLIRLNWWKLDTAGRFGPNLYYVKDGQPYLRKIVERQSDSKKQNNKRSYPIADEVDTAIPFWYDSETKSIMIPVSGLTVKIIKPAIIGIGIISILYILHVIIGGFFKFLIEIGQGTPFSARNLKRLRRIALSLFLIPTTLLLINFSMYLVFYSYFTKDVTLSNKIWSFIWLPYFLCVIFSALYISFRKAKQLQEENDLTV